MILKQNSLDIFFVFVASPAFFCEARQRILQFKFRDFQHLTLNRVAITIFGYNEKSRCFERIFSSSESNGECQLGKPIRKQEEQTTSEKGKAIEDCFTAPRFCIGDCFSCSVVELKKGEKNKVTQRTEEQNQNSPATGRVRRVAAERANVKDPSGSVHSNFTQITVLVVASQLFCRTVIARRSTLTETLMGQPALFAS